MEAINDVDGVRISYREFGDGPPLILVHGSALSGAIWRGLGYIKALQDEYRVVTLDLRGHGRSGKPHDRESYSMDRVVGDIGAVLDAAGITAAHYFGYSFGARIGFSLLAAHADRVLSFISAGGTYLSPTGQIESLFFPGYDAALASGGMPEFLRQWSTIRNKEIDPQTAAAFLANDPAALRAYFSRSETEPGIPEHRLQSIPTRTLLLAGTKDRLRYRDSERAAALMPDAQFHALPGKDHERTLHPATEVLEHVRPFLYSSSL